MRKKKKEKTATVQCFNRLLNKAQVYCLFFFITVLKKKLNCVPLYVLNHDFCIPLEPLEFPLTSGNFLCSYYN